jgi:DivIVA domain-containing protein
MTLSPEDIERKVFKQEFRGYNQEEVDTFLDRIVDRMVELIREHDLLTSRLREAERLAGERVARVEAFAEERIAEIEQRAHEAMESERLLKRALLTAERAADETLAQATTEAEQTLMHATTQAEQTLGEARREADQILMDARRQSGQMLADARQRASKAQESSRFEFERIQRTVAEFTRLRDEYRDRVRATVGEHLARFEQAGDLPHVPAQLIDLTKLPSPNWPDLGEWEPNGEQDSYVGADAGHGERSQSE